MIVWGSSYVVLIIQEMIFEVKYGLQWANANVIWKILRPNLTEVAEYDRVSQLMMMVIICTKVILHSVIKQIIVLTLMSHNWT